MDNADWGSHHGTFSPSPVGALMLPMDQLGHATERSTTIARGNSGGFFLRWPRWRFRHRNMRAGRGVQEAMPRYFFDLDDGDRVTPDAEGTELADKQAARSQALHMLGEIAKGEMRRNADRSQQRIHIHDGDGTILLTVSLFVQD
jgi:hypothetical protein